MATRQHVYGEYDTVDDHLLHEVSKYVRYEQLGPLSRELGIKETERQMEVAEKSPGDQIFEILSLWCSRKDDHNVQELIKDMSSWQQEGYLDRAVWQSELFTPNLLFFQKSFSEEYQYSMMGYEESRIFEDLGLEKTFWAPRMCTVMKINTLKDLKEIENHIVLNYLEHFRIIDPSKRDKLISLFAELNSLYFPPFETKKLIDLPKLLLERKEYIVNKRGDDEANFKDLIHELESTIWNWGKCSKLSYEYLVCIVTLSLFGFDVEVSFFTIIPNEKQLETLSSMLSENLEDLTVLHKTEEKQAFVLNIAVSNYFGKTKIVPYILEKLPDTVPQELSIQGRGEKDLAKLKNTIELILSGNSDKDYKNRGKFLSMHFQSIFSKKVPTLGMDNNSSRLSESLQSLLEKLRLSKYYPNKLTHLDVIKLIEDARNDVGGKPSSLPELPWYFIRKMFQLTNTAREVSGVETKSNSETEFEEPNDDSVSHRTYTSHANAVHPLDLIYAVLMCADEFLGQELVEKMSKFQYAVPFILPSPAENINESQNEILHWGLSTISKTCSEGKEAKSSLTKTLVNFECPLVSCLHLGDSVPGKLRILNEMLGDNRNNGWPEDLEGGKRNKDVSQGIVEISWQLPGSRATDKFETPVVFANMSGDAQKYPFLTEKLSKTSTVTCIFTQTIDSIYPFLEANFGEDSLKSIIVVILWKPDDKDIIEHGLEELKVSLKKLKLKEHKIITYPFEDKYFFEIYKDLLKKLQTSIKNRPDARKSLSCHSKFSSIQMKEDNPEVKESVQSLLEDLSLTEYYPKKIGYVDVINLTEHALKDVNEKPSTLQELPWYFMRGIIGLNSTIREKASVVAKESRPKRNRNERKVERKILISEVKDEELSFSWSEESEDEEGKDKQAAEKLFAKNLDISVHPLDLIYVIFLCADDFLRQELLDKMSKCQYAVPFILPSPAKNADKLQSTVLHWGLQAISRTYRIENGPVMTKNLLNVNCPLVSFLSLNIKTTWTSKLLNKMLSPQQETFWHEGLEGGRCPQKVSQGMVEVSWYLPFGRENDEFKTPVTFVNLRGNVHKHPIVTANLTKLSTTTCIFIDRITKELLSFLETHFGRKHLKKIVLIVLFNPTEKNLHSKNCKKLKERLKLDDSQVINCSLEDSNFHTTYYSLKMSLQTVIEETISLSKFIAEVKSNDCMEVDDVACREGYMAAQRILSDIDAIESDDAKSKILPCQSDITTREKISRQEKERFVDMDIGEMEPLIEYGSQKKEHKWQLQWTQLQYPISDIFTHFLMYITNLTPINRKYFLQSLKRGLNERSVELLQPLYEEYQMCRLEEQSEKTDRKLKKLNEQLTYSSLGLEHFFREVAIIYENIAALRQKITPKENQLEEVLDTLSKTMADILLDGEAIEILDGDVVHSPVMWLKAVLNKIENKGKLHIFKVSALGAQSSGKSTLLNTIFGLNFPVSSGRCTRGAYMQLVKIEEQLSRQLQCDYLLVIDSEGLMSRVSKCDDYDNKLATFVIGLSDLTLVVIKGEGNEMQDVLPIAIHVFLRMNVLGELQACHFVHQNMGAFYEQKKMHTEIDAFVKHLDERTRAAAKEAGMKKYTRFKDVLHYDKNKDNTYVCGLWDGAPPMGKTTIEYYKTMQRLKGHVLERLAMFVEKKNCSTITDFSKRLEEIWKACKYENFVFSFRNVLAMETYKELSKIFSAKQWEIKVKVRSYINRLETEIKDETLTDLEKESYFSKIQNMKQQVKKKIVSSIQTLSSDILHYFQCVGCYECSTEVRNRHFLSHYRDEFVHDIKRFEVTLNEEAEQSAENLRKDLATSIYLNQLSSQMDSL